MSLLIPTDNLQKLFGNRLNFFLSFFFFLYLFNCPFSLHASTNPAAKSKPPVQSVAEKDAAGTVKILNNSLHKRVLHIHKLAETPATVNYVEVPKKEIKEVKKMAVGDNYAAIVNGQIITMKDYKDSLKAALSQLNRQEELGINTVKPQEEGQDTRRSVLSELIDMCLIREQGDVLAITVPTAHIVQKINEIKRTFPSEELFKNALLEEGISLDKLNEGIRDQILTDMISEQLAREYEVSDEQIWGFYNKNKEMFIRPEMVRVSKIVFRTAPEASAGIKKLKDGESFDEMQKKYITEFEVDQSLIEDDIVRGQLSAKEEKHLFRLSIDDISSVIQVNEGYAICKVLEKRPAEYVDVKEAKEKIKNYLRVENQQIIYTEWLKNLRDKSDIKINPILLNEQEKMKQPTGNIQELVPADKKKNKTKGEEVPGIVS